ncbi:MAG: nucleotidyltransferase family protein [Anaerolineales bacterium]|nr:nucleotidyltransferase family protein [Anaerolineales bacterium]
MKLTEEDRTLVHFIGRNFPPQVREGLPPPPASPDWGKVIARAERQRLTPLLFESAKKTGMLREIPPQAVSDFRRNFLRSANQSEEIFRELAALLDSFAAARIPVIVLKGGALAVALYDTVTQRPMCDLDLLIPKDAVPECARILAGRGYMECHNLGRGFEQEFRSELSFVRPDASGLMVEPHWHIFNPPSFSKRIPVAWFWERAAPVEIRGRSARMLSPAATLLHLTGHYSLHHGGAGLLQLYDIARVQARWGKAINAEELAEAARSFGLLSAVQAALREAAALWRIPVPEGFDRELHRRGNAFLAEATSTSRYFHHLRDFMGVAGWKNRLAYLWKLAFPSREYLRQRYGMREDRLAALYYAYRLLRGGIGMGNILLDLVRNTALFP